MDMGEKYIAYDIGISGFLFGLPYSFEKPVQLPDQTIVLLCHRNQEKWEVIKGYETRHLTFDTLVFKYNSFVEYKASHLSLGIKQIDIEVRPYSGSGFYIEINKNGDAHYYSKYSYRKIASIADLVCTMEDYKRKELWNLLAYINAASLNDNYVFRSFRESIARFNIYFDDGSVKKIEDYALAGTMGLRAVYNRIYELKECKSWVKR
ncbi:MAG: hypothetical protein K0Q79_3080 [Flavipsychrobacter sp.]|jgi:hypothetical protein|nr:hypothetical protein [Flavipsychrobacter sp.]